MIYSFVTPRLAPADTGKRSGGVAHGRDTDRSGAARPALQGFTLSSDAFQDGDVIPRRFGGARGVSPPLSWSEPPEGSARFAIIMDDPDAVSAVGHTFVHWVAAISAQTRELGEGASAGGWGGHVKTLADGNTSTAYRGPRPPSGTHRYHIAIYAMSAAFAHPDFRDLPGSAAANDTRTYTRRHFEAAFAPSILASCEIAGTYSAEQ